MQRSRLQRFVRDLDLEVACAPYGRDNGIRGDSGEVVRAQLDAGVVAEMANAELSTSESLQGLLRTIRWRA